MERESGLKLLRINIFKISLSMSGYAYIGLLSRVHPIFGMVSSGRYLGSLDVWDGR